jgi:hypothetical protein
MKRFSIIFVCGPHRSGTTLFAHIVAFETGHDLVLEDEFTCSNRAQLSAFLHAGYGPMVVQCPFLTHEIHDLGYLYDIDMDNCLVVMMHRYRRDIIDSEERSPVNFARVGMGRRRCYHSQGGHASDIAYEAWADQCRVIPNAMDVAYESMSGHPLWRNDHKKLPFQHNVRVPTLPKAFNDGIRALQNI